jgi:hypothetical protein
MTPIEKAETALNARIERLQAGLRAAESEAARQFLFQSLVVCLGIGEALKDYIKAIGQYAQGRHGELKQTHDALTAEHAAVLKSGQALLEQLKASPGDRALLKEIEAAQRKMEAIQKNLKRGANALQRDTAPSLAMIDKLALSLRRLADAGDPDALKRAVQAIVEHAQELYLAQPGLPAKDIVDAAAWEKSAVSEIDRAGDAHEAFARTGFHTLLALDVMTLAVSPTPPETAAEATQRASENVSARLKAITTRLAAGPN